MPEYTFLLKDDTVAEAFTHDALSAMNSHMYKLHLVSKLPHAICIYEFAPSEQLHSIVKIA